MKTLELDIRTDAYELRLAGEVLATLRGGAGALLRDSPVTLREADMERLIEASEGWLMPSSRAFQQLELQVRDATGRVRARLGRQASFTPADVEQAFNHAFDAVAHGRPIDRDAVADAVLLRELVHHGRLTRMVLD